MRFLEFKLLLAFGLVSLLDALLLQFAAQAELVLVGVEGCGALVFKGGGTGKCDRWDCRSL